jgi:hypothetical protein
MTDGVAEVGYDPAPSAGLPHGASAPAPDGQAIEGQRRRRCHVKTRDRNAPSANGAPSARAAGVPATPWPQPTGDRLPAVRRERRPALAALAVLLVLGGALTSTILVLQSGDRVSAVRIAKRVPAGTVIPADAIQEIPVAKDPGVNYVLWSQRGQLARYYAATDLVPGSVLVGEMLTRKALVQPGQVVVGLSLKSGQYPTGLRTGDHVHAYLVGGSGGSGGTGGSSSAGSGTGTGGTSGGGTGSTGGGGSGGGGGTSGTSGGGTGGGGARGLLQQQQAQGGVPLAANARVYAVDSGDRGGSGTQSVSIVVNQAGAAAVARAAAAGAVALVLVPAPPVR